MDRMYRHQRFIYDLTRKPYLLGRDHLIAGLDPPKDGVVLEIACGTGRNLITAARRHASASFFGLDISREMLATARRSIDARALQDRIRVEWGDATDFEPLSLFGHAAFDRIFISYALSMIPNWRGTIVQALACLAPGGSLHIVDFGQQERLPRWFRTLLLGWLARFHVTPRVDLEAELVAVARDKGLTLRFQPLYRGYAHRAILSRP